MLHEMKLNPCPFQAIRRGEKDIEMRLNDEKRRNIAVGDAVRFINVETKEEFLTLVLARHEFPNFAALYAAFEKTRLGYLPEETAAPSDMQQFYSQEAIAQYGVVGLEIQVLQ